MGPGFPVTEISARILVCEDDALVARDLALTLEDLGYRVPAVTGTADDAVALSALEDVDLVLMDIRLPGVRDGIQAASEIIQGVGVPVVYLTAHSDDRTLGRASASGAYGYLLKPFDERELRAAVELALHRHRIDQLRREGEQRHRRIFEMSPAGSFVISVLGRLETCNRALSHLLGLGSPEEAVGARLAALFVDPELPDHLFRQVRETGGVPTREVALRSRDGRRLMVLVNAVGIFDARGELQEVQGTLVDVTEQRRLEDQLRRAVRAEAVGRLAGDIAHDFGHLLGSIRTLAGEVLAGPAPGAGVVERVAAIRAAAERGDRLVGQVTAVSPRVPLHLERLELDDVLARLEVRLCGLLPGEGSQLIVERAADGAPAWADRSKVEELLQALVEDAGRRMGEGGRIALRTWRRGAFTVVSVIHGQAGAAASGDEGGGERIFDPFSEPDREESGLALVSAYGLTRQMGGSVTVSVRDGEAQAFHVHLPRPDGS